MTRLRLTPAQISALECAGLEEAEEGDRDLAALRAAWDGRASLVVTPETRERIWAAILDRSNAEDAAGEAGDVYARRAARALAAVGRAVLGLRRRK